MKVKVIMNFNDLQENTKRKTGDIFECNEDRANYLIEHNAVEPYVEKIEAPEIKVDFKPTKKKKNKNK